MHRSTLVFAAVGLAAGGGYLAGSFERPLDLEKPRVQESYAVGTLLGGQLGPVAGELELGSFMAGLRDGLEGRLRVDPDRIEAAREERELAEANRVVGDAFRAEFASQPEVVTLESGLLYKVLAEGKGPMPEPGDTVALHYRGSFVDGTVFDRSPDNAEPVRLRVDRAIAGWSEALQRMPVGSRWQLVVPPELAYGEPGAGSLIGPETTLVFELQLVEVG